MDLDEVRAGLAVARTAWGEILVEGEDDTPVARCLDGLIQAVTGIVAWQIIYPKEPEE